MMTEQLTDGIGALAGKDFELFIGPRPGKKSLPGLADMRFTHCCTLLSEREDARGIAKICKKLECEWVWLPLEGGKLEVLEGSDIGGLLRKLAEAIREVAEPRIYLHCSAGIHRTGFFAYVLLRVSGLDADAARAKLAEIRPVTAEQVGEDRLELAERIVAGLMES